MAHSWGQSNACFLFNNSSSCWRGEGSLVRFSTAVMTTMAARQIAGSSEGRPVSVRMYLKLGLGRGRGRVEVEAEVEWWCRWLKMKEGRSPVSRWEGDRWGNSR